MKATKKLVSLLLVLVMLFMCIGCGGNTNNADDAANNGGNAANSGQTQIAARGTAEGAQTSAGAGEDKDGGTFVTSLQGEPKSFNPDNVPDNYNFHISQNLFSRLVQMNIDEDIMPDLATDWAYSEDGMSLTFHLQEEAMWHDGEPVTSEDVKFTFDTIISEKGYISKDLADIESIECPDEHTVTFHLSQPNAVLVAIMSQYGSYILPKHIYEGTDWMTNPANLEPIGSGPFKFVSYEPGNSIVIEAFDDYFRGRPYLDQVIYRFIPDTNTAYQAFLNGELDNVGGGLPPGGIDSLVDDPDFKILTYELSSGFDYLAFNFSDENFSKPEVRQAVALSVNNPQIAEVALKGEGIASEYYLPMAYTECLNDDAKMPARDVEAAKALLEEAGYTQDADGYYFECTLDIYTYTTYSDIAAILVENLKEAGIKVNINSTEYAAWNDKVAGNHDFEFTLMGGQMSPDISVCSRRVTTGGEQNYMGYSNPKVDELFAQGKQATDQETRNEIYKEIQVYLAEDVPYVPIYDFSGRTVTPAYVMDHPWTSPSSIYYSSACWAGTWLDKSLMN